MKTKALLLFAVVLMLLNGCYILTDPSGPNEQPSVFFTDAPVPTSTPIPTSTPSPTNTPTVHAERVPVDYNMVKGIAPATRIILNKCGSYSSFPNNVSQTLVENLMKYCRVVVSKYPTSEMYLDVDESSDNYVIIIVMGGTVFYQVFENQYGDYVYSDFPSSFKTLNSKAELLGDYRPIKIPNTSFGVIWNEGVPQLLANYVELPNGETYFTHYMDYSGNWSYSAYPWKEVVGIKDILASFPPVEMDIEPIYTQTTKYEYMGVKINAELVLDESIYPNMEKLSVPDKIFAEYIARVFFDVWWSRQENVASPTESDFINYMKSWADAQSTGDLDKWEKVKIENVWANDLTDGLGYKQIPYDFMVMYDGECFDDCIPIDKVSIVFMGYGKYEYITPSNEYIDYGGGGANVAGKTLFFYYNVGASSTRIVSNKSFLSECVSEELALVNWYLITNKGKVMLNMYSGYADKSLYKLLLYGGLRAE